jgi:hypothetical protein
MCPSKLRRLTLSIFQITAVIICLSLPALSQAPAPAPPPPAPAPTNPGNTLSNLYRGLIDRVGDLIPQIQNEIEGPLMPWLEKMSWTLAMLVIMFGFPRLWRENSGASADVFWWFGRVGLIFALMGAGPTIINQLDTIGQEIAWGGSNRNGDSVVLHRFYETQRNSFEVGYRRFTEGRFTVQPTGEDLKPRPGGEEAVLGVLLNMVSSAEGLTNKFEALSHDMNLLFSLLSLSRGILAFGDLWMLSLGGFLMIAVRLAAPIMIALAIDRNLAQKITYPFIWGVIILTLVWPIVAQFIRTLAYMGGNLAMSLDDSDQVYQWNPEMMQEILVGGDPYPTVILAIMIMTIAGLSLWMSPMIAYKLASGQVYESVSSTISGWMGSIVGAGIEFVSASAAANITNQADQAQNLGQFSSEMARAEAGREAGALGIEAGKTEKFAQLFADRDQKIAGFRAGQKYQDATTGAQSEQNKRMLQEDAIMRYRDNRINGQEHVDILQGGAIGAAVSNTFGGSAGRGGIPGKKTDGKAGPYTGGLPTDGNAGTPGGGGGKMGRFGWFDPGLLFQQGGTAVGFIMQSKAIEKGVLGREKSLKNYYHGTNENGVNTPGAYKSLDMFTKDINVANKDFADAQVDAANKYASRAAGGINKSSALQLQANERTYEGAVKGAHEVLNASSAAAQLRAVSSVMSNIGHNVARNAEQGMALRY